MDCGDRLEFPPPHRSHWQSPCTALTAGYLPAVRAVQGDRERVHSTSVNFGLPPIILQKYVTQNCDQITPTYNSFSKYNKFCMKWDKEWNKILIGPWKHSTTLGSEVHNNTYRAIIVHTHMHTYIYIHKHEIHMHMYMLCIYKYTPITVFPCNKHARTGSDLGRYAASAVSFGATACFVDWMELSPIGRNLLYWLIWKLWKRTTPSVASDENSSNGDFSA